MSLSPFSQSSSSQFSAHCTVYVPPITLIEPSTRPKTRCLGIRNIHEWGPGANKNFLDTEQQHFIHRLRRRTRRWPRSCCFHLYRCDRLRCSSLPLSLSDGNSCCTRNQLLTICYFLRFTGIFRFLRSPGLPSHARQQGRRYIAALKLLFAFNRCSDDTTIGRFPVLWAYISGLFMGTTWSGLIGWKVLQGREAAFTSTEPSTIHVYTMQ